MIELSKEVKPTQSTLDKLKEYQKEIDDLVSFELMSNKAKDVFPKRNKIGNKTFDEIKEKLIELCSGARRCVYCEDSVGDEVEHIHPKDLFPQDCFNWENYVYACGNCNGPKNNKFAIFRSEDGKFQKINPPKGQKSTQPPDGADAIINPRKENPLDYCMLDLKSTFKFVIIAKDFKDKQKADYTYNEVLRLNEREFLRIARENAYGNFKARLYQYNDQKTKGSSQTKLDKLIKGIQSEAHPTVWKEMQRQYSKGFLVNIDKQLNDFFMYSPEALNW